MKIVRYNEYFPDADEQDPSEISLLVEGFLGTGYENKSIQAAAWSLLCLT